MKIVIKILNFLKGLFSKSSSVKHATTKRKRTDYERDFAANRATIVVNGEDKHMVYVREFIKMVGVDPTLVSEKLNSNDNFISGADRYHLLNLELEKARKKLSPTKLPLLYEPMSSGLDKVYADDDFINIRREKAIDKIRSHKQLHNQDKILLRGHRLKWSMNNIGK
jgi:hypothetical protein